MENSDSDSSNSAICVETEQTDIMYLRMKIMNIPEIRENIFSFMPLESIKTCRLVCHGWNATAEPFLPKLSRILLYNDPEDSNSKLPDEFEGDFANSPLLKQFDKFCLNSEAAAMELEDLENFIAERGNDMKELTIDYLRIRNVLYTMGHKDLINLIPTNLSKLDVVCRDHCTQLIISLDRLQSIKILRVKGGILKLSKKITVAPVELALTNVAFLEGRTNYLKYMKINDVFDFRNLKILKLECIDPDMSDIELDICGVVNLQMLSLANVQLLNWDNSEWSTVELCLCKKSEFLSSTTMKIEDLSFAGSVLDLSVLPKTLKKLAIPRCKTKILNYSFAQNFVELQYLTLCQKDIMSVLTHFQSCANLTHLQLCPSDYKSRRSAIDVSSIPKSVRVLGISAVNDRCVLKGATDFELETLIMENLPFMKSFNYATEVLKTRNLFLSFSNSNDISEDEAREILQDKFQEYIVGPFYADRDRINTLFFPHTPKADFLIRSPEGSVEKVKDIEIKEFNRMKMSWWTKTL